MRRINPAPLRGLLFLIFFSLGAAFAWADADVSVRINGFSPSSVSINVGETVWFTVVDDNGPYCIQSTIGAWTPWYLWDYGEGVGIQFNERGDYYYRDAFNYANTGVVHVGTSVPNVPPTVTITSPQDGAMFTEPAAFTFAAAVTDPDNGVMSVEFYVGPDLVATLYGEPFSTEVTNLVAGNYALTVVARDAASAAGSASINISVQPATNTTITLTAPVIIGGECRFDATGLSVGKQAVLQTTDTLGPRANWTSLQTNAINSSTLSFSSPVMPGSHLYRVLQF